MRIIYRRLAGAIASLPKQPQTCTRGYAHLSSTPQTATRPSRAKMEKASLNVPKISTAAKRKRKMKAKAKNATGAVAADTSNATEAVAADASDAPEPVQPQDPPPKFALESPQRPTPTPIYLQRASMPPSPLPSCPQPLLIILDLNGTVLYRKKSTFPPTFTQRQNAAHFLRCIVKDYHVMVWSSAQKSNVKVMVDKIFGAVHKEQLIAVWDRSYLGLSKADFYEKVQVYKKLEQVWADPHVAASHPWKRHGWAWDQNNTVLIDDTSEKAASEPHNLIEIPSFTGKVEERGVLEGVLKYLSVLQRQKNVSCYIRTQPFRFDAKG